MTVWHIATITQSSSFLLKWLQTQKILLQTINVDLGNKNNEENKVYA